MPVCPACSFEIPAGGRFCASCGRNLTDASAASAAPTAATPATSPQSSLPSLDQGRFLPGTTLAERYRIVGLLGRGGMGEVYRADDLKLGQPVALKFLPQGFEQDSDRLTRFLNEVKLARQVSHSNVCRVYDVGEMEGQHYLSMEYVDGEDLASLLRRIGRLPEDKAVEVARQLCAGLAAAHEQGILHRDLKPANVMIDGRGHVKITDFGLAGLEETIVGADVRSGTPGYMAPEQLEGREVTTRSDIYVLGLVLYELFTGKPPFTATTAPELLTQQRESMPSTPTSHVAGLDASVERIILRCLERDPRERPASALAVAAALPGADPLAAALAAGETPSPAMVADAGDAGGMRPPLALACLIGFLICIAAAAYLSGTGSLLARAPLEKSSDVLEQRAREIAQRFGSTDAPVDKDYWFFIDNGFLEHRRDADSTAARWEALDEARPTPIQFAYRQSPRLLVPTNTSGHVSWRDPQFLISGMVNILLDSEGRLEYFSAVPPHMIESPPEKSEFDWSAAFEEAALEIRNFEEVEPIWLPEIYCDRRAAWLGHYPDRSESELRIEACTFHGQLVYFETKEPWDRPWRMQTLESTVVAKIQSVVGVVAFGTILLGAGLLARRNVRLGRGDMKGALRLVVYFTCVGLGAWLLRADHVANALLELGMLTRFLGESLYYGLLVWTLYVALEPFVRRRWPDTMVSWSRLLAGRFRDPLVGKHVLIGAVVGGVLALARQLHLLAPGWLGRPPVTPHGMDFDALMGARAAIGYLLVGQWITILVPMVLLFLIVLLRMLLRVSWLAYAVFVILNTLAALGAESQLMAAVYGILWSVALLLCLVRFGLVAAMTAYFFSEFALHYPITLDFSTWYADGSLASLTLPVGVVIYAFWLSLAGQSLLGSEEAEP